MRDGALTFPVASVSSWAARLEMENCRLAEQAVVRQKTRRPGRLARAREQRSPGVRCVPQTGLPFARADEGVRPYVVGVEKYRVTRSARSFPFYLNPGET
jgi:hypothetical protein